MPPPPDAIRIRGARTHNLQNIDLDIPRNQLVVVTGPSGSGKSTLAVDTLCAEGQRQYIESLSMVARQFMTQMERPDVDLIEGLQPTIVIDQRAGSPNPRSTVATATEIYDFLRLLLARLGEATCPQCGLPIRQQTTEQILATLFRLPEGTKAMILAPRVRGRRGAHHETLETIRKAGFVRVRIDGTVLDIDAVPELAPRRKHDIEAVVDRVVIRPSVEGRIRESINLAAQYGDDRLIVTHPPIDPSDTPSDWKDLLFSTRHACPACQISYEALEPRTFSFNSPYGACPTCDGLGSREQFDPDLVIPDPQLSLDAGAIAPWRSLKGTALAKIREPLDTFLPLLRFGAETPLDTLRPSQRDRLLRGNDDFPGILNLLEREYATTRNESRQEKLATYRGKVLCADCGGARLRPEALSVRIGGRAVDQIVGMSVAQASKFFEALTCEDEDLPVFTPIVDEIRSRLRFLEKVGLDYLTLDRSANTLSGGERQRVRLATGIGSGLVGICYVLDEPSVGLHPRDNERLIGALRDLQGLGNTVLVVEHDAAIMRSSDHLIDMGPGAGHLGGAIVATGTPDEVMQDPDSITGRYLSGALRIERPTRRRPHKTRSMELLGATLHNLQKVDIRIPLGTLTCVTGVSGSGKSSLVVDTLGRALARRLHESGPKPGPYHSLRGIRHLEGLINIDQSPIGRTPRSNPATYTGIFDEIRKTFAGTQESRRRGFGTPRFSFNVKGGRCETCRGQGQQKLDMHFLPDLFVTCRECDGTRFNRQTLEVKYRDRSIADVLDLEIREAADFFANFPRIAPTLRCLDDVGLGYLTLGQAATTLSGGEAQRIKLARELARPETGKTLYLLDEPTTGLHFDDVRKLLDVLGGLVDLGNTVLVIEHNMDVVQCADWVIDMGPEGGDGGGRIVATGTPEEIAAIPDNHTGQFLRR